jgi:hypothetical protein
LRNPAQRFEPARDRADLRFPIERRRLPDHLEVVDDHEIETPPCMFTTDPEPNLGQRRRAEL